jgi:2-methylisocitrate lyase-like PEP mutase family enzyme
MRSRSETFRALHQEGTFVIPNPFDRGSARLLAALGFSALATTSSGMANSLGRLDMRVTRDDLLRHVADLAAATDLPLHVDAERGYADDPAGVADTVAKLAEAGAVGCSIEDWNPATSEIDPIEVSVERVAAAAGAARAADLVLTARCEHHLHGVDDLDATIARLVAYRDAGADVVYAPGSFDAAQIARIVGETGAPVNAILLPGGPTVDELRDLGVRRISVGGALARVAYGAVAAEAQALLDQGQHDTTLPRLDNALAYRAFGSASAP